MYTYKITFEIKINDQIMKDYNYINISYDLMLLLWIFTLDNCYTLKKIKNLET